MVSPEFLILENDSKWRELMYEFLLFDSIEATRILDVDNLNITDTQFAGSDIFIIGELYVFDTTLIDIVKKFQNSNVNRQVFSVLTSFRDINEELSSQMLEVQMHYVPKPFTSIALIRAVRKAMLKDEAIEISY